MRTMSFYAGDDEVMRIQAEQERFAALGIRISKSSAIRSLILRASQATHEAAPVTQVQPDNPDNPDNFLDADKEIYQILNSETADGAASEAQEKLFNSQTIDLIQFREKGKIFT